MPCPPPSPQVPETTPLLGGKLFLTGPGDSAPPPLPLTLLTSDNLHLKTSPPGQALAGVGGQCTLCPQASKCRPSAPPALLQVW